ncbi:DMT family transporter [Arthrobacter sp. SIMBA_036]|uniref:DMT family transporter n=1 Tax=Arthrobacter sp. SIMBA_036 TaxID=3085778 RepID=UPI003979D6F0
MSWVFLSLAIATEVGATVSLRASEELKKKLSLIPIVVGYICANVVLSMALAEGLALGVAYGIWVACGVALTANISPCLLQGALNTAHGLRDTAHRRRSFGG